MNLLKYEDDLEILDNIIDLYNEELVEYFNKFSKEECNFLTINDFKDKFLYYLEENWNIIWFLYFKNKDEKTIYINWFFIFPKYQLNWYWKEMLNLLEKILKKQNISYVLLETENDNKPAISFYEKMWFFILNNENLKFTYFSKFYTNLVDSTIMFYKKLDYEKIS
jgi:ribosomal protein S18 acetylase RimI-like enzyme